MSVIYNCKEMLFYSFSLEIENFLLFVVEIGHSSVPFRSSYNLRLCKYVDSESVFSFVPYACVRLLLYCKGQQLSIYKY
jgi:hypothetical protein